VTRVMIAITPRLLAAGETKIFEVSQVGELSRYKYAEIDVVELIGEVEMQIYYAPIKGHYRKIYGLHLSAEVGMPG